MNKTPLAGATQDCRCGVEGTPTRVNRRKNDFRIYGGNELTLFIYKIHQLDQQRKNATNIII